MAIRTILFLLVILFYPLEAANLLIFYPQKDSSCLEEKLSGGIPTHFIYSLEEIKDHEEWFDLILVVDQEPSWICQNFDQIIISAMQRHFPDFDGVLHFHSDLNPSTNQAPVVGKPYYQRLGTLYYPDYQSSCYLDELTYVSRILGKELPLHQPLFLFSDPSSPNLKDLELLNQRRLRNFDLDPSLIDALFPKEWSILICTLDERLDQFSILYQKLQKQIHHYGLEDQIEILFFRDNRERSIGEKRNALLRQSRGKYINFIDDDDDVHDDYIKMLYDRIKKKPDCVSLYGMITFDGNYPTPFFHSIAYDHYFEKPGAYYRPPNPINPIKRSIAAQFLFPHTSYTEDTDWAMQIARSKLLKKEESVFEPYYFYKYIRNK